jgi:Putative zinc-finger
MTTCDIQASGSIELYFYGELEGAERQDLARHVRGCEPCRRALEELAVIREALNARPDVSAPPGGDWAPFMARLDAAVSTDRFQQQAAATTVFGRRGPASRHSYAGYLAMAALLALVTMSVLFVARSRDGVTPEPTPIASASGGSAARRAEPDPSLTTLSEQHFEKSKLVLLGLATRDAGESGGWEYERDLAAGLLNDTRLYRMAAENRGMSRLAGVLRDLELVLLQTSMTDKSDPAALAQIQRLIRRRDVLEQMESVTAATTGS